MVRCRIWDNIVARKIQKRALKDRILLVTEGKKTEQNYFKGLRKELRISVEIKDINKSSLDSLLKKVKRIYNDAWREKNPFTQVIFIIDKDDFTHYESAKNDIKNIDNFCAFFSEPCFEYWLLLHFQPIEKPFNNCSQLKKHTDFKKHFPNYNKTDKNIIQDLLQFRDTACKNAKNNPHTNLDKLVQYLQKIK